MCSNKLDKLFQKNKEKLFGLDWNKHSTSMEKQHLAWIKTILNVEKEGPTNLVLLCSRHQPISALGQCTTTWNIAKYIYILGSQSK